MSEERLPREAKTLILSADSLQPLLDSLGDFFASTRNARDLVDVVCAAGAAEQDLAAWRQENLPIASI